MHLVRFNKSWTAAKGSECDAVQIKIHYYSNYSSDALKLLMTMYEILDVCDYFILMHKFTQSDKWKAGNSDGE